MKVTVIGFDTFYQWAKGKKRLLDCKGCRPLHLEAIRFSLWRVNSRQSWWKQNRWAREVISWWPVNKVSVRDVVCLGIGPGNIFDLHFLCVYPALDSGIRSWCNHGVPKKKKKHLWPPIDVKWAMLPKVWLVCSASKYPNIILGWILQHLCESNHKNPNLFFL